MNKVKDYNVDSISKILEEVDVMDLVDICPPDEYIAEAKMILKYSEPIRNMDETGLSLIVSTVFALQFGQKNIMGKQEKIDLIAKKIMALG